MKLSRTITQRWLFNTVGIIVIVLIAFDVGLSLFIKNFYYSGAQRIISSKAAIATSLLERYADDPQTNYVAEIKNLVQNFDSKQQMELMAIDNSGKVTLTSSGFEIAQDTLMPDYVQALNSEDGSGFYVGKQDEKERIMAVCVMVPSINNEYSALRYVISTAQIDKVVWMFITGITLSCVLILCFVVISGLYFVKSIVIPVRQVGGVARKIATGNFETRLQVNSNDEIGELCEIINFMADEIEQTEKIKNEFISSVSHELRTPLTSIKGWGETILISGEDDEEIRRKGMGVIIGETERLSSMVEELLDFSRMQNGRLILVKSKLDILAELGEAVLMFTDQAKRQGIEIVYDEPEMLPAMFGDKNRLRQVFVNIIDNALKYSDNGGTLTIEAYQEGEWIVIKISDTGCGIEQSDLPFIKQKFYKANYTRRGSGIGLAVADEIVTLHNGQLDIKSKQGFGTTVTIKLPIVKKDEPMSTQIKLKEESEGEQTDA